LEFRRVLFRSAEQQAARYFATLLEMVEDQTYVQALTKDFKEWQRKHVRGPSWLTFWAQGKKRPNADNYDSYLQWLKRSGRLDRYLERSISYMYMRDLGKNIDSPVTQAGIRRMVDNLTLRLFQTSAKAEAEQPELISLAELYRWAQKEGVETAVVWAIEKLSNVAAHIPDGMNAEHAQRKLIKIMIGVVLHAIEELDDHLSANERASALDKAIRLGYSYGLTYPFIDDLLDARTLTSSEKEQYSQMIRTSLMT